MTRAADIIGWTTDLVFWMDHQRYNFMFGINLQATKNEERFTYTVLTVALVKWERASWRIQPCVDSERK